MGSTFLAILVAVFSLLTGEPEPADELLRSWPTEGWTGGAYRDNESGDTYCLLWRDYGADSRLKIGRNESGYWIAFVDRELFKFENDRAFYTPVRIEPWPDVLNPGARAASVNSFVIFPTRGFMMNLTNGDELVLDEWGIRYEIRRVYAVVEALDQCHADDW